MSPLTPAEKEKLLILGDWGEGISEVKATLKKEGYRIETLPLSELKDQLSKKKFDLAIVCLPLGEIKDHSKYILEIKQLNDAVPIILASDNDNWEPAVNVMKLGVNEYVHFPLSREKFRKSIVHHLKMYHLTKKVFFLEEGGGITSPFEGMIGTSKQMQENFRVISAVAKSNATVLVTGGSGTGKELVAKAIHRRSNRANYRFVDLNCGAIPKDLLENELFGHEKGAFTGAHKRYCGSFEVAHKGTLFLDEISEMDPLLQVKLLRVLQERSFMRIGGTQRIDVDVRIIAATNQNLSGAIEKGTFREDLFYRLNVVNLHVPPLKERREDIPLLATHFLEYYSAKNNRIFIDFADNAIEALINYEWPGNIRELENTIERIIVLHNDSQVKLKFLPKSIQQVSREIPYSEVSRGSTPDSKIVPLVDLEKNAIEVALMKFRGNISIVARKLKIGQATLYRKVKKYGLQQ